MKAHISFLLLLGISTATTFAQSSDNQDDVVKIEQHNHNSFREGEIIVKINASSAARVSARGSSIVSGSNTLDKVFDELGVTEFEELMPLTGSANTGMRVQMINGRGMTVPNTEKTYLLKYDTGKIPSVHQAIEKVSAIDDVEFAEPNYLVYTLGNEEPSIASIWNDPLGSEQWGFGALNLHKMHDKPSVTTKRPVIAILDTGIDITHPDLEDNIWTNELESNGESSIDDDGNGFADDIHGWDFVNQTARIRDNNGHGTHCAGIAAAVANNGKGIIGANEDALIMPVTVMQSDGTGDVATIIKGVDYASANGADIISMSIGTYASSMALEQALGKAYTNAVLVAAAGNDGHTIDKSAHCISCLNGGTPCFPAAYTFVLGVESSKNIDGSLDEYSNRDNTGHIYSGWGEEKLYNYELRAPGSNILSTYPGGKYKSLNGTSMACPFAAGAISRLLQVKEYASKELLFGDLINASGDGNIDVLAAYLIKDEDRKPALQLITYIIDDSEFGDGDGRPDAGEIIDLYPVIKNFWGQAKNIKCSISLAENEDPEIIEIINNNVIFGSELSGYFKNKSINPLRIKVNEKCIDGRHICVDFGVTCDNTSSSVSKEVIFTVENGVEIGGMITEDLTLYPNVHYIVTSNLAIPEGITLTIKPGTILKFKDGTGLAISGKIDCHGTQDSMIVFTKADLSNGELSNHIALNLQKIDYVIIEDLNITKNSNSNTFLDHAILKNCIVRNNRYGSLCLCTVFECCNVYNNIGGYGDPIYSELINTNYINNEVGESLPMISSCDASNIFNNNLSISCISSTPYIATTNTPSYYGSSIETIVRKSVLDMYHPTSPRGFGMAQLSNMLTQPSSLAHGIVWKVVVNGKDSQDEFDQLPPLGVGRHKFEVYFNRPMNKMVPPIISMGGRPPYTQVNIAEDGIWNDDGTIYTAYLTITGKNASDGLNRISVYGAQDDEFFEIPDEKNRFNVNVQAAGSMTTGLIAEAGLGKVTLEWETTETSFDDLLGFNVYRFDAGREEEYYEWVYDEQGQRNYLRKTRTIIDTIKVNETLIEPGAIVDSKMEQSFVDYNVIPGTTYYYYVKEMSTDLSQNVVSNPVACTPLTASKGDANGSLTVDVADVVTEINYLTGQNPQPFIFEAADVNSDQTINILDVVGTVNIITAPQSQSLTVDNVATFTVQDGILYVESPVALGGVQVTIQAQKGTEFKALSGLDNMERADAWISDDKYMLLAYSMSGKSIATGKQALLEIGDATIGSVVTSDISGRNVLAINGTTTSIEQLPFGFEGFDRAKVHYFDISGREVSSSDATKQGIYIVRIYIDGKCVKTYKQLNK